MSKDFLSDVLIFLTLVAVLFILTKHWLKVLSVKRLNNGLRKSFFVQNYQHIDRVIVLLTYMDKNWDTLLDDERINAKTSKLYLQEAIDLQRSDLLSQSMKHVALAGGRISREVINKEDLATEV